MTSLTGYSAYKNAALTETRQLRDKEYALKLNALGLAVFGFTFDYKDSD